MPRAVARRLVQNATASLLAAPLSLVLGLFGLGLLGPALFGPGPFGPGDAMAEPDRGRERAIRLAREGRCESALPQLEALGAASLSPVDSEVTLVTSECLIRMQRYPEAIALLEVTRAADPEREGVDLMLAIGHYHAGDMEAAEQALARAEARDPTRAAVHLYRGLLQLREAEHELAISSMERARIIDPGYSEPLASFYQGLAYAELTQRTRAVTALSRVVEQWPGSGWADEAKRKLQELTREQQLPWWVHASAGLEYDSNVVLRGEHVPRTTDEDDGRGFWNLSGARTLIQRERWSLGLLGSYWGSKHFELDDFDTHFPTLSLWLDRSIDSRNAARVTYEYGFAWVDDASYLSTHGLDLSLYHAWDLQNMTRATLRFSLDDFRYGTTDIPDGTDLADGSCPDPATTLICSPPGVDEKDALDRDAWLVGIGAEHTLSLNDARWTRSTVFTGGYEFSLNDSEGTEYDYQAHAFWLGGSTTLPQEIVFEAELRFTYRPFGHPTVLPDPRDAALGGQYPLSGIDRLERQWQLSASLKRALTENINLDIHWRYDDNYSSAKIYDYDRHVVGFSLSTTIGP